MDGHGVSGRSSVDPPKSGSVSHGAEVNIYYSVLRWPECKKIMIPYEVPCQKFYKIFHSSLTELYPLLPGRQTFSINHCSLAHT